MNNNPDIKRVHTPHENTWFNQAMDYVNGKYADGYWAYPSIYESEIREIWNYCFWDNCIVRMTAKQDFTDSNITVLFAGQILALNHNPENNTGYVQIPKLFPMKQGQQFFLRMHPDLAVPDSNFDTEILTVATIPFEKRIPCEKRRDARLENICNLLDLIKILAGKMHCWTSRESQTESSSA